jgi:hypothetical protein
MTWSSLDTSTTSVEVFSFLQRFFPLSTCLEEEDGFVPVGRFVPSEEKGADGSRVYAPAVFLSGEWRRLAVLKVGQI